MLKQNEMRQNLEQQWWESGCEYNEDVEAADQVIDQAAHVARLCWEPQIWTDSRFQLVVMATCIPL